MQLPESLLALLLLHFRPVVAEPQWPHNLPRHMKYFPEDEVHAKRGQSIVEKLQREKPVGMKKMSSDEGEMFLLDNWIFAGDLDRTSQKRRPVPESAELGNTTIRGFSPLRPHCENPLLRFAPRALFARDFACPEGTNNCSGIGAPNSCCGEGSTCINIEDTGYGPVGCCPSGQTCQGGISCDEARGYSSCPDSPNGGCCLPGYSCQDVGCVIAGTSVTYVQPSTSAVPPPPSSTAVVVIPTTPSAEPTPTPTTSYTCSTGWFSCPASVGGGCCQDGLQCATGASCINTDSSSPTPSASSQAPSAPVRPTDNSQTDTSPPTTDIGPIACPTGFYVCSAYYPSGCCRVGRDCQTTGSCAPPASNTIVNSNGVTVVGPSGAGIATDAPEQQGNCPGGWYSCAAGVGGNCCPNGFACGNVCTATASGATGFTDKVAPSTATTFSLLSIWMSIFGAVGIGIVMIVL